MSLGLLYWLLMLLVAVFGLWSNYPYQRSFYGSFPLLFVLLVIIGVKLFGPPISK